MPYGSHQRNPVVAALHRRWLDGRPPLQVANGTRADTMPGPQVADPTLADDVKAVWLPTIPGQQVPMQGEAVTDLEPGYDE